ncbi:MAG: hypothetical protein J7517_03985 [Sphingobium yanoikuyae]|nr:hypothetical protein [Sphingobium yanoikuyae]
MAARADAITYDRFITSSEPVGETPLDATLWRLAVNWVVAMEPDRSSTEATALGKNPNCQTLASVTPASSELPLMLSLLLFLPQSWASNSACMSKAGMQLTFPVTGHGRPQVPHAPDFIAMP